ncbi:hypothetical protein B0T25DRAFT_634546 [Lasiosphaeria hispida]|uniref:G domain-containing protein n=1 Tax=Lasiosphaeria hispida TaxID=260671 RepID=A0AAJ0H7X4_9PEZI|nr:hypothetical protein B0T25DRAFT_634546 [Lasiosphaeria hispida]
MAPQPKRRPIMVVLAGVTGAGKTTFTSVASDREDLGIGDGLDPCTQDPQAVQLTVAGRSVILIDTPGFDDKDRSDMEILEDIGKWLSKQGFTKHLDGLILLHPITQDFDSTLEKRRTRLLEKILGKNAYKRVAVATTMWGSLVSEKEVESDIRRRWGETGVWDDFRQGGATLTKHFNNKESAHRIIQIIIDRSDEAKGAGVLLQEELARKGARFTDTSLGRELETILEDDICVIQDLLLEHRCERPPESYRKSQNSWERWKWCQWEEEYNELTKNLELRQIQLRRLNSFIVLYSRSPNGKHSQSQCGI